MTIVEFWDTYKVLIIIMGIVAIILAINYIVTKRKRTKVEKIIEIKKEQPLPYYKSFDFLDERPVRIENIDSIKRQFRMDLEKTRSALLQMKEDLKERGLKVKEKMDKIKEEESKMRRQWYDITENLKYTEMMIERQKQK